MVKSPAPLTAVSDVTEVLHVSSEVQVTRLRDVISTLQPRNAKYLVEVSVVNVLPTESRHWTRSFCGVEWRYMVQLRVRDGAVTIPVLVCDDVFFHALPPCDLWTNHSTHALLVGAMDRLRCARRVRLALQSYIPKGRAELVFQVCHTQLVL